MSTLYTTNEALIADALLLSLLAATEAGFYLGRRAKSRIDEKTKSQISFIQGSLLGVLGVLLGFTISIALIRLPLLTSLPLISAYLGRSQRFTSLFVFGRHVLD